MPRLVPNTIRGQLIAGTVLLQCLLVAVFAGYIYQQQSAQVRARTEQRLLYQVHVLSDATAEELADRHMLTLESILAELPSSPTIRAARITDLSGNALAYGGRNGPAGYRPLTPQELAELQQAADTTHVFLGSHNTPEVVAPVWVDGTPTALAWITPDMADDERALRSLLNSSLLFGLLALAANALISLVLAQSITHPLNALLRATRNLVRNPEGKGSFPLRTSTSNEAGVLTHAFNSMVAALQEQRAGLNDTLALLDSMLANAPIGFAFFDRSLRCVRINQFMAERNRLAVHEHLGRPMLELFPAEEGSRLAGIVEHVFSTGESVHNVELHDEVAGVPGEWRTLLLNFYPVHTSTERIRWVGAVAVDTTQHKKSEEALRRSEKLAATGRLAASIAHEINNPLEAVTNLLYLLQSHVSLDTEATQYAEMAQHELARVSQITQQTLRFYRQSTQPTATRVSEVLDSVLTLYRGRIHAAQIQVVRVYDEQAELHSFGGELRQLFANLIGNALDAMPHGGTLTLRVYRSRDWSGSGRTGVRVIIADTGSGMTPAVRKRIFEPFYTTKEATGTGLGLWVSAEIVEKHHGRMRVRSRAVAPDLGDAHKSGTVFLIFFPLEAALLPGSTEPAADGIAVSAAAGGIIKG
jgi:signal transduction histidine kinase/HAMP domain-containing protein